MGTQLLLYQSGAELLLPLRQTLQLSVVGLPPSSADVTIVGGGVAPPSSADVTIVGGGVAPPLRQTLQLSVAGLLPPLRETLQLPMRFPHF